MSILDMQRMISRLATDQAFLASFSEAPQEACKPFNLSPNEVAALRGLDHERLKRYAEMLRASRVALALKAFPCTRAVLPTDFFERFTERYCRDIPPIPAVGSAMFTEAMNLASFIERQIASGELQAPYLRDVMRYERNVFYLSNSLEAAQSANQFDTRNSRTPKANQPDPAARPRIGEHVIVTDFEYNVLLLVKCVSQRQTVELSPQPNTLIFVKRPRIVEVSISRVNSATAKLLELADCRKTISEIAAVFGSADNHPEILKKCLLIVDRLVSLNVLTLE